MDDAIVEAAEVAEEVVLRQGQIEPVAFSEWLSRTLDLFSMSLRFVMSQPLLRFFAVFGVFWVSAMLCLYLLRTGKAISR